MIPLLTDHIEMARFYEEFKDSNIIFYLGDDGYCLPADEDLNIILCYLATYSRDKHEYIGHALSLFDTKWGQTYSKGISISDFVLLCYIVYSAINQQQVQ